MQFFYQNLISFYDKNKDPIAEYFLNKITMLSLTQRYGDLTKESAKRKSMQKPKLINKKH